MDKSINQKSNQFHYTNNHTAIQMERGNMKLITPSNEIDPSRSRFPFCIVWTPLPMLSWILPFIGHVGIATSSGVIYDFAGPFFVSVDSMAFGKPTKYWQLDPSRIPKGSSEWDVAIINGSEEYRQHMASRFNI
eukprot:gene5487-8913_t